MKIDMLDYHPERHVYFRKQMLLIKSGALASDTGRNGAHHVHVAHDGWCGFLKQPKEYCDCDPTLTVETIA